VTCPKTGPAPALRRQLERLPLLQNVDNRRRAVRAARALRRARRRAFEAAGSERYSHPEAGLRSVLAAHLDFDGGVFVEAGANDGFRQSNTYYLERFRDWRGVLVEPIPELYLRCLAERPRATVYNCALVSAHEPRGELRLRYADLGSTAIGADEYPFDEVNFGWDRVYEVSAPARTLSEVIDAAGVDHIDFCSLDVEGFEVQALQGLDLERHAPTFFLVEYWTQERLAAIRSVLGSRYELIGKPSDHDALFRRRRAGSMRNS
jgi:FkbM family methyltransferase